MTMVSSARSRAPAKAAKTVTGKVVPAKGTSKAAPLKAVQGKTAKATPAVQKPAKAGANRPALKLASPKAMPPRPAAAGKPKVSSPKVTQPKAASAKVASPKVASTKASQPAAGKGVKAASTKARRPESPATPVAPSRPSQALIDALSKAAPPVGLADDDPGPLSTNEVFDEADGAQHIQLRELADVQRRALLANRPEKHPDFDGLHCVMCDEVIPAARLAMFKIRCIECQREVENRQNRPR